MPVTTKQEAARLNEIEKLQEEIHQTILKLDEGRKKPPKEKKRKPT